MTEQQSAERIVVGVDGSEQSTDALRWAARLAEPLGATIDAVIAWDAAPYAYGWVFAAEDWHPDQDAAKLLQTTLDEVFGSERPAGLQPLVRQGHPAKVLVDAAADAALLIVGSRGRGGFTGLLLGSVSSYCAAHAACPVLVAHGDTRR